MLDRLDPTPKAATVSSTALAPQDLNDLVALVWRGKWIIAACAGLGLVAAVSLARFVIEPKYQSEATLVLTRSADLPGTALNPLSGLGGDISAINTRMEVLGSDQMMRDLSQEMRLMEDPEFNPKLEPGLWTAYFTETGTRSETDILNSVAENLGRAISISNVRNSDILKISARSNDPRKSASLANTLARLFVQKQVDAKTNDLSVAVGWLSDRVAGLEQEIADQEDAIRVLQSQTKALNPEALASQLSETRTRRDALRQRGRDLTRVATLLDNLSFEDLIENLPAEIQDQTLRDVAARIRSGDASARTEFATRMADYHGQINREHDAVRHQTETLTRLIEQLEVQFDSNAAATAKLRQVEREARATQLLHETFLSRLKETALRQGVQTADSRVISAALPGKLVAPRTGLLAVVGLLAGAALGFATAWVQRSRRSSIPSAAQLESITHLPVLGHLPMAPIRHRRQLVGYLAANPTAALAEAARNLRTSLLLSDTDTPPQTILCTSSVPDEGKTTMSICLAHNLSQLGRSVLLIEADIRCLSFRDYFPENPHGGLVSALSEGANLDNLLRTDTRLSVDVLMGEHSANSAADLFSSQRFGDLMNRLRARYDHILIDSPPVLAVSDARVIGQSSDAILMSVAPATTSRAQLAQALREFTSVNLRVSGLVVSDLGFSRKSERTGGQAYGVYARYYSA